MHDSFANTLLALAAILVLAKVGGALFERFGQPAVLGEVLVGILLGNLAFLTGGYVDVFEPFKTDQFLKHYAEIGAILLLFSVGLETSVKEMAKEGLSSFLVALVGVTFPFVLGYFFADFVPLEGTTSHTSLFLGATLTATSVGITARVLRDLGQIARRESKIILGAAVIDDVIGLVILAVVSGILITNAVSFSEIFVIAGKALLFIGGTLLLGSFVLGRLIRIAHQVKVEGMMIVTALAVAFLFAYVAELLQLAAIVGAFAAGMLLTEEHFHGFQERISVTDMVSVLSHIFVPVFFVLMGMWVDLSSLATFQIFIIGILLTLAAVAGKLVSGLAALGKGIDRLSIGIGMIPRGEVGLIFASMGLSMKVISPAIYSVVIAMILLTTLLTPPLLKWSLGRQRRS